MNDKSNNKSCNSIHKQVFFIVYGYYEHVIIEFVQRSHGSLFHFLFSLLNTPTHAHSHAHVHLHVSIKWFHQWLAKPCRILSSSLIPARPRLSITAMLNVDIVIYSNRAHLYKSIYPFWEWKCANSPDFSIHNFLQII